MYFLDGPARKPPRRPLRPGPGGAGDKDQDAARGERAPSLTKRPSAASLAPADPKRVAPPRPAPPAGTPRKPRAARLAEPRTQLTSHEAAVLRTADETGAPVALLDVRATLIHSWLLYSRLPGGLEVARALNAKLTQVELDDPQAWLTKSERRQTQITHSWRTTSYELSDRVLRALRFAFLVFARRDVARLGQALDEEDPERLHVRLAEDASRLSWRGFQALTRTFFEADGFFLLSEEEVIEAFETSAGDEDAYFQRHADHGLAFDQFLAALSWAASIVMQRPPHQKRGMDDPSRALLAFVRIVQLDDGDRALAQLRSQDARRAAAAAARAQQQGIEDAALAPAAPAPAAPGDSDGVPPAGPPSAQDVQEIRA